MGTRLESRIDELELFSCTPRPIFLYPGNWGYSGDRSFLTKIQALLGTNNQ